MNRLNDMLVRLTVDELKSLIGLVTPAPRVAKKADLIDALVQCYAGDGLRSLYERLDEVQRLGLAEAVYESEGCLDLDRFEVESRCGAVAVGSVCLLPPLSSGGARVTSP